MFGKTVKSLLLLSTAILFFSEAFGESNAGVSQPRLTYSGDLRLRYESDWDSQNATGVPRDDRTRGRLRLRGSAAYDFDETWMAGIRLRSGNPHSQQSPHLTFSSDSGGSDDIEFVFDRYFVQYKEGSLVAWAGRNSFPFWQQNELFWDDDVTPTGVAGSYEMSDGKNRSTATFGAFALPDGVYGLNGNMVSGQIKYTTVDSGGGLTVAVGLHNMTGDSGAEDLRNRNGERDYLLGVANAQWKLPSTDLPVVFGIDLFENFKNYSAADVSPFSPGDSDQTTGCVFSVKFGSLSQPGSWQVDYYYAQIETFAVNASYAQDDWVRFGSATQTDSSDFSGHEFRFSYLISNEVNLVARLFLVDAITSVQNGNRFRLDLNAKF